MNLHTNENCICTNSCSDAAGILAASGAQKGTSRGLAGLLAEDPFRVVRFALGALLFAAGLLLPLQGNLELIVFAAAYLLWGGDVLARAAGNIFRGQVFDENFLMSIATLGAFAIGEYPEGVAVMVFYQVGELLQGHAVGRSRRSIQKLMDIRPDFAFRVVEGGRQKVDPGQVEVGDTIAVRPGERVPLDGKVTGGVSVLDLSALTGESLPREVSPGDEVLSGSVNSSGLLYIQVTKVYRDSTVNRILSLVEGAESRKAKTERFITRFARYYTPAVVAAAALVALVPPLFIPGQLFSTWIYRALVFLVISCPCALVISIPLGFFGGIGGASRKGILVKGGNYLEALARVDTVIFDKTGTLTRGAFRVRGLYPRDGFSERDLLYYGSLAARHSSHPLSISLLQAWEQAGGGAGAGQGAALGLTAAARSSAPQETSTARPGSGPGPKRSFVEQAPGAEDKPGQDREWEQHDGEWEQYEEIPGRGIILVRGRANILMGNEKLLEEKDIFFSLDGPPDCGGWTSVHLAVDGQYAGSIVFDDEIREDSARAVRDLKRLGVGQVIMLTGDREQVAEEVGRQVGVDRVFAGLLPHQKMEQVEELERERSAAGKGTIAFVGDGINDAPALARADIGVAMGGVGSDAALEAADVVLMTAEPSKLVEAIEVARKTGRIVRQNVVFALGTKGVILLLGLAGLATMWGAVFADVGVALLAVLNAMRAMR